MTSIAGDGTSEAITYNAEDMITRVTGGSIVTYGYDGAGNRIRVETDGEPVERYEFPYASTKQAHLAAALLQTTLDYTTTYSFDLVGNRLRKETDNDAEPEVDERVVYEYDENDRLLQETKNVEGVDVEQTVYDWGWDGAAMTSTAELGKTVTDLTTGQATEDTDYAYNLQGRLSHVKIDKYVDGVLDEIVTHDYSYDPEGIRVVKVEAIDNDADGLPDVVTTTNYLNDKLNLTGYSQVIEETTTGEYPSSPTTPSEVHTRTYTIGSRVLAQYDDINSALILLPDGHGSTRILTDALANVVANQLYHYDAYGNPHGFEAADALTTHLYNAEDYDALTGLQYLRARWYEAESARFLSPDPAQSDPFAPLSRQVYAYAQADLRHLGPVFASSVVVGKGLMTTHGGIL